MSDISSTHVSSVFAPYVTKTFTSVAGDSSTAGSVSATIVKHGDRESPMDGMTFTCDNNLIYGGLTTASVYAHVDSLTGHIHVDG